MKIFASSKKKIYLYEYKKGVINSKSIDINKYNINYFIQYKDNYNNTYYFCFYEEKVVIYSNLFYHFNEKSEDIILNNFSAKSMIQITEFLFVIKSNKIASKGKDTLIFINSEKKKMNIKLDGNYSFVYTTNGLAVMPIERGRKENDNIYRHKVLLCACKKYIKGQKNGILLVNIKIKNKYKINISSHFYPTGNFEVYCICPLLNFSKKDFLKDYEKFDTNYFLVGGFDLDRCKGKIKLYKVNYAMEYSQTIIEYIQDIIFDKNKFINFKGPISCITQSSINGDILISCWGGNIYLFSNVNFDFVLNYDKQDEFLENLVYY